MSNDDSNGNGYVDQVRANTRKYIRELLDEQADLRRQLDELRADLERREKEREVARKHEDRFAEVEQQNSNLAALYTASYQLHTPHRADVLQAIHEIVINLIGSEEFAVFGFDGERRRVLSHMGVDPETLDVEAGVVTIPLEVAGRRIGLIAVHRLLPQKPRLEPFDHELISLLATHAATALYCSDLHERSGFAR